MVQEYGKTGWDDNNRKRSNKYLKLKDGKNFVRMVTDPYKFFTHKVKFDNDTGKNATYGRTIKCAINNCPLCKDGNPAKTRYIAGVVVNDGDGKYQSKYLEMGTQLFNKIKGISENMPGREDPTTYEVNIVRDPAGGPQAFYDAFPGDQKPLMPEQIAAAEEIDLEDLQSLCKPPTPEEILSSIDRIANWIANSQGDTPAKTEVRIATGTTETNETVGDEDFSFKVNKKS